MQQLKRIHCLVGIMILTILVSCTESKPMVKHVGVILFGDSRQPQTAGFQDGLKELGYTVDQNVKYTVLNAKNKRKALPILVDQLVDANVDLLVASGGLEADEIKKKTEKMGIPTVVLYVNAIKERKLVIDRRTPGWSVTGVDNLNAELSGKRVELLKTLVPSAKKILVLYYEKIAPSRIGVEHAKQAALKLGITIDARAVTSRDEIKNVMTSLQPGEVDAMLTVPTAPIDNALKAHIIPHVNRLKLPLMTHSKPLAEAGALASYGAPFYELGKQAARLADKLLSGVAASNIPFEIPKKFLYSINDEVRQRIALTIPSASESQIDEIININK